MDYQTIEDWKNSDPFQPFRLVMTDGRAFEIKHPNMLWPGRYNALVGIPDDPSLPDVPARHANVAMLHIVRAEPLDTDATVGR